MTPPSGPIGSATAPSGACRCGSPPHPEKPDRCARGHVLPGNLAAAVVGHTGARFMAERGALLRELRAEVAIDLGHASYEDAPAALRVAIDGLLAAAMVRDAALARIEAEGGPLSAAGRARRAVEIARQWDARAESWARLVGLQRTPRPPVPLAEWVEETAAAGRRGEAS